ncbi:MAG: di-heme enzyme [Gammaproteobacteria bacterium]|nr:di-heme enzyme [Gammaproteobacteria bacterium]
MRKLTWQICVLACLLVACSDAAFDPYAHLPERYPRPVIPDDNRLSPQKIELGRWLFYDRRLSVNRTMSCASCHRQELAFTDGLDRSVGATGQRHPRGAMSLVNVAYASRLTWANNNLDRLEVQALTPLFGEEPVEMGMSGREDQILGMLRRDARYSALFARAFPGDADPYSILNLVRATASFLRTMTSFDTPYDRYLAGEQDALAPTQLRGMDLFFSERLECFHCHGGFNFTDSSTHQDSLVESVGFHNNGLYNIGPQGDYPPDNRGLYELTGQQRDIGRFRAPSLRNIELTAPYMHDGSILTLDAVIDHYAAGGRTIDSGPYAGVGSRNPFKSSFLKGFQLTDEERNDLLAFLRALTDRSVISDPSLADPWPQAAGQEPQRESLQSNAVEASSTGLD